MDKFLAHPQPRGDGKRVWKIDVAVYPAFVRIPLAVILFCLGPISPLKPQTVSSPDQSEAGGLSGSDLSLEAAMEGADGVFVGKISKVGKMSFGEMGVDRCGFQVQVVQALKGLAQSPSWEALIVNHVKSEVAPKIGSTYLFFTSQIPKENLVLKLLSASDENIAKVKQLLAQPDPFIELRTKELLSKGSWETHQGSLSQWGDERFLRRSYLRKGQNGLDLG